MSALNTTKQMNQRIENQIEIEKHFSRKSVVELINSTVETFDLSSLEAAIVDYRTKLNVSGEYNHDLFEAICVKNKPTKIANTMLRELMKCKLEKDGKQFPLSVIAQRLGRKLMPKTFVSKFYKSRNLDSVVKPSFHNATQMGVMLLEAIKLEGIFVMTMIKSATSGNSMHGVKCLVEIDQRLVKKFNESRFLPPLIVEPAMYEGTNTGGYITKENKTNMIESAGNPFVENQEHGGLVYEAINKLQSVAFNIKEEFYNDNYKEYLGTKKKFELLVESKTFQDHHTMLMGEAIWFAWKGDARARLYSKGHYINPQGDEFGKAELEFHNKEMLNESGVYHLKSGIAGTFESYNKFNTPDEKVVWFDENEDAILDGTLEPLKDEEVYTFKSLLIDYKAHLRGQEVGTILHLDATNSALQIYSVLTGDKVLASMCNLIDNGTGLQDGYQLLADAMNKTFGTTVFTRGNVKRPFMVFLYGAGKKTILEGKEGEWLGLRELLPTEADDALWDGFESTLKDLVPGAFHAMELIYQLVNGKTLYEFTTPGMFNVQQHCFDNVEREIEYKWNGERKTLTGYETVLSKEFKTKALAPNFVHSLDAYLLHRVVREFNKRGLDIVTIHDSFGVHPNNAELLKEIYREILADMLGMNLFDRFRNEVNGGVCRRIDRGELTKTDILLSKLGLN